MHDAYLSFHGETVRSARIPILRRVAAEFGWKIEPGAFAGVPIVAQRALRFSFWASPCVEASGAREAETVGLDALAPSGNAEKIFTAYQEPDKWARLRALHAEGVTAAEIADRQEMQARLTEAGIK